MYSFDNQTTSAMLKKYIFLLLLLFSISKTGFSQISNNLCQKTYAGCDLFSCLESGAIGRVLGGSRNSTSTKCFRWKPADKLSSPSEPNPTISTRLTESTEFTVCLTNDDGSITEEKVMVYIYSVELEIYDAPIFNPNDIPVPKNDRATIGAQTFVNIDNDDHLTDEDYDLEDDFVDGGDNELFKLKAMIRFYPDILTPTLQNESVNDGNRVIKFPSNYSLKLDVFGEATAVKIWESNTKGRQITNLNFSWAQLAAIQSNNNPGTRFAGVELWVEGVECNRSTRGTIYRLTVPNDPDAPSDEFTDGACSDEASSTVLCIKDIEWVGDDNGEGNDTYDTDVLGANPLGGVRVFPDARAPNFNTPKNTVKIQVTFVTGCPKPTEIFLRAFDVDDPSPDAIVDGKLMLDPNDKGVDGDYDGGTGLSYSIEEDNRGNVQGNKFGYSNGMDDGIFPITFAENADISNLVEFQVSQHAGDNYRLAGYADKEFLKAMRNFDKEDGIEIKHLAKATVKDLLEVKKVQSKVLTVWRLLHLEIDSMKDFQWSDNQIVTLITDITTSVSGQIEEIKVENSLRDKTVDTDNTSAIGYGRFQDGAIIFNSFPPVEKKKIIENNGQFKASMYANNLLSFLGMPGFLLEPSSTIATPVTVDKIFKISSDSTYKWEFATPLLTPNVFQNGTFKFVDNPELMDIKEVDINGKFIITKNFKVKVTIRDDDVKNTLPYGLTQMENEGVITKLQPFFKEVFILPIADGGNTKENNKVDFENIINLWNKKDPGSNSAQTSKNWESILKYSESKMFQQENFWVSELINVFQSKESTDADYNFEGTTGAITDPYNTILSNTEIKTGGNTSAFFYSSYLDYIKTSPNFGAKEWIFAHEIGHQFGLGHGGKDDGLEIPEYKGNMGIMAPPGIGSSNMFIPRYQNLIRSRKKSPGQL